MFAHKDGVTSFKRFTQERNMQTFRLFFHLIPFVLSAKQGNGEQPSLFKVFYNSTSDSKFDLPRAKQTL